MTSPPSQTFFSRMLILTAFDLSPPMIYRLPEAVRGQSSFWNSIAIASCVSNVMEGVRLAISLVEKRG